MLFPRAHARDRAMRTEIKNGYGSAPRAFGVAGRWLVALMLLTALAGRAWAHHILGIPHYAYDEAYPQTPVLTYVAEFGPYEIKMTGYPGKPQPGEQCTLHVYIRGVDEGELFAGPVTMTVFRDHFIGENAIVYGPVTAEIEDSLYKFFPRFGDEANYLVRIEYEAEGAPWIIDLPMVVGEPGSPWLVLGALAAGVIVFLLGIRAVRIKRNRRKKMTPEPTGAGPTEGATE